MIDSAVAQMAEILGELGFAVEGKATCSALRHSCASWPSSRSGEEEEDQASAQGYCHIQKCCSGSKRISLWVDPLPAVVVFPLVASTGDSAMALQVYEEFRGRRLAMVWYAEV